MTIQNSGQDDDENEWTEIRSTSSRHWRNLFFNPDGNLAMLRSTYVERFLIDVQQLSCTDSRKNSNISNNDREQGLEWFQKVCKLESYRTLSAFISHHVTNKVLQETQVQASCHPQKFGGESIIKSPDFFQWRIRLEVFQRNSFNLVQAPATEEVSVIELPPIQIMQEKV